MNRKLQMVGALILTLLLTAGLVPAGALPSAAARVPGVEPAGMLLVRLGADGDLDVLEGMGVPVYARLEDGRGPYLLVGGRASDVAALVGSGLDARLLDADATGAAYYLAAAAPGLRVPDWGVYGRVLLDDGERVLLRLPAGAQGDTVDALAQAGARVQAVTLDPKPLRPRASAAGFTQAVTPDPLIASMMGQVSSDAVSQYDRELAGELPVWVDGDWYTITTRYTNSGTPIQKAGRYVGQRMADLGMDVEYHVWDDATNPNVIGEMPGLSNPEDIYIIGGHLDDVQGAPGADDNASGSVAAMLAADILSQYQWGCTLRFAFWTGEEQGLLGSHAYAQQAYNAGENILGYLNLDMIAYNTVGSSPGIDLRYNASMPPTQQLAQLFADVVDAYSLNLVPDIGTSLSGGSDHSSFWQYGYTSILAIEDQGDFNPYYHGPGDTPAHTDLPYFTEFVKASLGTFAHMTGCLVSEGIGALDGHVTAAGSGAPIPGVEITMLGEGGAHLQTTTDAGGYYTQTLLADTYTVTAEAYAYLPAVITGVVVVTDSVTTQDIALELAPEYVVSGTVTEAGSGVPLAAEIVFEGSPVVVTSDPGTGYYEAVLAPGSYTMHVRADQHRSQERPIVVDGDQTQSFVLEPVPCILLVDDDNNAPDVLPYYTAALDALDYEYDVFAAGGGTGPSAAELEGYDVVIWFSGDAYSSGSPAAGPDADDEAALAVYLEGGGSLFLSSQDYLYDMGLTAFGQNYLGIGTYTNDQGNATTKYGVTGDPVGGGLGPYTLVYPSGFSDYGDIVNAAAGASVAFRAGPSGGNNLDVDRDGGAWKTVFFGTSWVPVANASAANGQAVLGRILDWFGGCECDAPQGLVFEWLPPEPLVGETVTFTGTAQSDLAVGYTWDFGDGTAGQGAVVSHAYLAPAGYTVSMTATNFCGSAVLSHTVPVTGCLPPANLEISWAPEVPVVGENVELTGSATGDEPITYTWSLGDGETATGVTVTHAYSQAGEYPIVMTATNACDLAVVTDTLAVVEPPCLPVDVVTVTATTGSCRVVLDADLAGSPPFSYTWDLGAWGLYHTPVVTAAVDLGGTYPYTLTAANCAEQPAVYTGTFTVDCVPRWHVYLPLVVRGQ